MPELWIGSIVIDCSDFPRMLAFWREALHYAPRDPPDEGAWSSRIRQASVRMSPCAERTKAHCTTTGSIWTSIPPSPRRKWRGLLRLGATLDRPADPDHDFVTLADPDGNLIDVIDKRGWAFGRRS